MHHDAYHIARFWSVHSPTKNDKKNLINSYMNILITALYYDYLLYTINSFY